MSPARSRQHLYRARAVLARVRWENVALLALISLALVAVLVGEDVVGRGSSDLPADVGLSEDVPRREGVKSRDRVIGGAGMSGRDHTKPRNRRGRPGGRGTQARSRAGAAPRRRSRHGTEPSEPQTTHGSAPHLEPAPQPASPPGVPPGGESEFTPD